MKCLKRKKLQLSKKIVNAPSREPLWTRPLLLKWPMHRRKLDVQVGYVRLSASKKIFFQSRSIFIEAKR